MAYRGKAHNGAIGLEEGIEPPAIADELEAFKQRMVQFCGIVQGPPDMSERHDFYAHGKIEP